VRIFTPFVSSITATFAPSSRGLAHQLEPLAVLDVGVVRS
jgi:hypothetical protein